MDSGGPLQAMTLDELSARPWAFSTGRGDLAGCHFSVLGPLSEATCLRFDAGRHILVAGTIPRASPEYSREGKNTEG